MVKVAIPEVKRFMTDCLRTVGAQLRPAIQQADLLIYADKMGHSALGLSKLNSCVYDIESGLCSPNNKPTVLKEEKSMAWIDVKDVLGATAGHFAMDRAIKMANKTGVGWVAATGCSHDPEPFGYWVKQAAKKGLVGMVMSTLSAPLCEQLYLQSVEPKYIGSGRSELVPVKDIRIVYRKRDVNEKNLLTPCCEVLSSEQKQRGLETMLELFKGFPGKENLQSWSAESLARQLVHCFVAVNPACIALGFGGRPVDCIHCWKEWDEMDVKLPELLQSFEGIDIPELEEDRSLHYMVKQINASNVLAHKLGVKPMDLEQE